MATFEEIAAANQAKRLGQATDSNSGTNSGSTWYNPTTWSAADNPLANTVGTEGTKTNAAVRGFADTASLGLGKVVNAVVSPLISGNPNKSYWENAKAAMSQEQNANAAALKANPGSYLAGSLTGGIAPGLGVVRAGQVAAKTVPQFPTIARSLGMGTAGGITGGIHGATEATIPSDILSSAGKEALISGGINAAFPVAGKLYSGAKNIITGNAAKDAAAKESGAIFDKLSKVGDTPSTPARLTATDIGQATATAIGKQISIPALGALAGMGYKNTVADEKPPWATDPYSAALQTGVAGAQGAALGTAAKWSTQLANAAIKGGFQAGADAISSAANSEVGQGVGNLVTKGATEGTPVKDAFGKIKSFITPIGATIVGPLPVKGTETADAATQRQAAMLEQATPEGRAVTNTTTPQTITSTQDFFDQLKSK
jgi:hypothetical protein